nr:hypothetical protein JVH1_0048 [Rhodococcus sp. JVH1]
MVFLVAEVLVHFGFECGFENVRGELVEQSFGPTNSTPSALAWANSCWASFWWSIFD